MAEDWAIDVRKYAPNADESAIAGIVRHCGIALRSRDASLVSFADAAETGRVRESFLKKKLALTDPDDVLDAAIARVGDRMSADPTKNRVTVYYLLAEAFGRLGMFGGGSAAAPVPLFMPAPATSARRTTGAMGYGQWLPLLLFFPAALGIAYAVMHNTGPAPTAVVPAAVVPAADAPMMAPMAPVPAVPAGAGIVSADMDGKPGLAVYFDTGKADVTPEITPASAPLKAYMDAHPGSKLAVSGYNDPSGNATLNAELSKNRAENVAAALSTAGIPANAIDLVKPADTTDASTTSTEARRVEVKFE